jgi:hypothetical protein
MNRIKRVEVGQVRVGQYVTGVDDEDLVTDEDINENYDASEGDWHHVVRASHWADVSRLTLAYYNGELYRSSGAGFVWLLVDDAGDPVEDEPTERELEQLA